MEMPMKWYVVHTQPGCENKVVTSLQEQARQLGLEEEFGQILVPSESVVEQVGGRKRASVKKFFPSYVFVQMNLGEKSYHLVRNLPKVTGFLGGKKPLEVSQKEIATVQAQVVEGIQKPRTKLLLETGDQVRVVEGPFSNLSGIVDEIKEDKQKVKVRLSIFGRSTSIDLEYGQIQKIS